ncbi:Protein RRP6-like 1 [Cardamine amara subsp. amara]|uniref:Protein RRP6-like 1 n=1 Tax=Cardamine amara subsp. amara TaxID=228776 RepID=A0ABD0ZXA3_CARAN
MNEGKFKKIDEFEMIQKRKEDDSENNNAISKSKIPFHVATISKPQEEYKIRVNNGNFPFEHVWLEKSEDNLRFIHPLEKLSVMDFVDKNLSEMRAVKPQPLEDTPFKLVKEVDDLKDLAAKLQTVGEFAVDLEHNQYRSFQGLTCVMQISTRTEDYVVDTFKLWDHIGPCLREIFKDTSKKKVMHGADRDIIWLQRDFGIYVCNLFDTGQASRVLKLERKSLEFLLKHYCGVTANKQYQNADWRIRPLPDVMTRYAREDTHYLLYIYDVMRKDLDTMPKEDGQSDSPLIEVYKRSYDVCTQIYEKELLTGNSYLQIYGVQAANLNAVQLAIAAGLCEWRDQIAREDDESTGYVLPNKTLLDIAKDMPINVGKLRRLLKSKHPYIERNFDAVVSVIRKSMLKASTFEPVVQSLQEQRLRTISEKNIETRIDETGTEASSPSLKNCMDVSKKQSSGFGGLPSKRKFESDIKVKEEVKLSKSKPNEVKVSKSKAEEVIIVLDDDDESDVQTSETNDAVPEASFEGPKKSYDKEIIVLDDDDDDESENDLESREDEQMSLRSESSFMSLKRGFL